MTLGKLSELRKQRDQRPSNKTHPPPSIAPQNDRAGTALHDFWEDHREPGRCGLSRGRSIGASAWVPALFLLRCGAVLPAWCDQIPTPAENQLYPYSGHSCAHRHPHGSGKLFIDGRQITENRSCYECHPPGPTKTVRTAVGSSIFPANSFGRTSKPAAGEREPAGCRACQIKKNNPPV